MVFDESPLSDSIWALPPGPNVSSSGSKSLAAASLPRAWRSMTVAIGSRDGSVQRQDVFQNGRIGGTVIAEANHPVHSIGEIRIHANIGHHGQMSCRIGVGGSVNLAFCGRRRLSARFAIQAAIAPTACRPYINEKGTRSGCQSSETVEFDVAALA